MTRVSRSPCEPTFTSTKRGIQELEMAQPPSVEELIAVLEEHQRTFGQYGPARDDIKSGARGLEAISVMSRLTGNVLAHVDGGSILVTFGEDALVPVVRTLHTPDNRNPIAWMLKRLKKALREADGEGGQVIEVDILTLALVLQSRVGHDPPRGTSGRNEVLDRHNDGILTAEAHLLNESRRVFSYFLLPGVELEDYLLRCQPAYSPDHSRMERERRSLLRLVGEDGREYATHLFAALRYTLMATAQGWLLDVCERMHLHEFLSLVGLDEPYVSSDTEVDEEEVDIEDDDEGDEEEESDEDAEETLKVDRKAHYLLDTLLRQIADARLALRRMRVY